MHVCPFWLIIIFRSFHSHRKNGIGPNRIGEDKEVPWKEGQGQHDVRIKTNRPFKNGPLSPSEIENMLVNAEKEVIVSIYRQFRLLNLLF